MNGEKAGDRCTRRYLGGTNHGTHEPHGDVEQYEVTGCDEIEERDDAQRTHDAPAEEDPAHAAWPVTDGSPDRRSCGPNNRPKRSEEHTSELQSHSDLVCRLLLEKKK